MNSIKLGDRVRLKPDARPYFPELYFKGVKTVIGLNEDQDMAVLSCYEQNPKGVAIIGGTVSAIWSWQSL